MPGGHAGRRSRFHHGTPSTEDRNGSEHRRPRLFFPPTRYGKPPKPSLERVTHEDKHRGRDDPVVAGPARDSDQDVDDGPCSGGVRGARACAGRLGGKPDDWRRRIERHLEDHGAGWRSRRHLALHVRDVAAAGLRGILQGIAVPIRARRGDEQLRHGLLQRDVHVQCRFELAVRLEQDRHGVPIQQPASHPDGDLLSVAVGLHLLQVDDLEPEHRRADEPAVLPRSGHVSVRRRQRRGLLGRDQ